MKTFDRQKARQIMLDKGIKTINTFIDDTGSYDTVSWNRGHRGILAKKAKAAATAGFDESMFHWDPNQKFDRNRYRERMRNARDLYPEYNRRQRKAYALMDRYHTEITPITDMLETMETPKAINTDVNFDQFVEDIVPVNLISLKTQEVRKNNTPVATNPFSDRWKNIPNEAYREMLGSYFSSFGGGNIPQEEKKIPEYLDKNTTAKPVAPTSSFIKRSSVPKEYGTSGSALANEEKKYNVPKYLDKNTQPSFFSWKR